MSEEEKRLTNLMDTGSIPGFKEDSFQVRVLLMLHEQNLNQSETNRALFKKIDDIKEDVIDVKETTKEAREGVDEIKGQFKVLNGKTSATIERVVTLEDEKKRRSEEEIKKELIRKGMMVIPKKITSYIKGAGKVAVALSAVFGVCAGLYPLFLWFIGIAFHFSLTNK